MTGTRMYVCICNALNDHKVEVAINNGAATVSDVFRHHGCSPRCGSCVNHMRTKVSNSSQSQRDTAFTLELAIAAD